MRILAIDDQRIFKPFTRYGHPYEIHAVHATTSQRGLEHLFDGQRWDEVWLDHDLGMESHGSGTDIVNAILEAPELPDVGLFFIHTMNPVGGEYMMRALSPVYPTFRIDPSPYLDFDVMYAKNRNPWLAGPRR